MAISLIHKLIIKKTLKAPDIYIDKYNFTGFILWSNWCEYVGGSNGRQ